MRYKQIYMMGQNTVAILSCLIVLFGQHVINGFGLSSPLSSFHSKGCRLGYAADNRHNSIIHNGIPNKSSSTRLCMALTPVGPFCPFRSSAAIEMEPKMERMSSAGPEFAVEMARIQYNMQMGIEPDPDKLRKVADDMDSAVEEWETLVARLRLSSDFQTREYAKLTQAHLENSDTSVESVASMMKWQSGCMRAMANNTPPPMPPPDIDLAKMMQEAQQQQQQQSSSSESSSSKGPLSMTAMTAAEKITSNPFNGKEAIFDSPTVKEEYETLCRDHMNLIEFGGSYATFDPTGKLLFLDEIEKIQDRWDVFFARFKLMGQLNQDYVQQCNNFLASMNMTEDDYLKLLKQSHEIMRADAEKERNDVFGL